jgi:hypothetical protein
MFPVFEWERGGVERWKDIIMGVRCEMIKGKGREGGREEDVEAEKEIAEEDEGTDLAPRARSNTLYSDRSRHVISLLVPSLAA